MKKVNKTVAAPPHLLADLTVDTTITWDSFIQNNQTGKLETQTHLRRDQRNICAYCEIDLHDGDDKGHADFRVEHFHPKKRPPDLPPNWGMEWSNLLAVCSGGNVSDIGKKERYTNPDYSCDVPKGHKVLDGLILNPLTDVPAFPPLFDFQEDGRMLVGASCPPHLQDMAARTILELRLSEDSSQKKKIAARLSRLRQALFDQLNAQVLEMLEQGKSEAQALAELAQANFPEHQATAWPAFFSSIRWYLGTAAEARLENIEYNG